MELKRTKVVLALAVVVVAALVVLWLPSEAWAGPPPPQATDAGSLLRLIKQMKASVAAWETGGQNAARGVFGALATLNILWLGVEVLFAQSGDIRGGLGKLGRELMVTSVLYAMIAFGPQLAREIVGFMRVSADGIGGGAMEDQTWNALQAIVKASVGLLSNGEVGVLELLWLGLCVAVVIVVVGLTGGIMLMVEAAAELIIGLGVIVLAGGGAIWTRFLVTNYLRFSFSAGLALYVMRFVEAFVIGNLAIWAKEASGASGSPLAVVGNLARASTTPLGSPETIFTLVLMVIIQLLLVISMPTIAVILASGGIGRLSEWAGIGAAQRLGGMGAQGLRQMAATMSGGAARAAAAAAAAGHGLSVLGSGGGAMPPAAGAAGPGGAREQGSGSARGLESAANLDGSPQEGASPAPSGVAADGDGQAHVAGSRSSEPADFVSSGGGGGGAEGNSASTLRGREHGRANDGSTGRGGSRSTWNGQSATAPGSNSRQTVSTADAGRSAGASGRSDLEQGRDNNRPAVSAVGGSAAPGGAGGGEVGVERPEGGSAATVSSRAASSGGAPVVAGGGASGGGAGRGAGQGASAGSRSVGAGTTHAAGASRDVSGAGRPASSLATPAARPDAAPSGAASPGGGHVSGVRGGAYGTSAVAQGAAAGSASAGAATTSRNGASQGGRHEARRVAATGPGARGEAGKRGEHG